MLVDVVAFGAIREIIGSKHFQLSLVENARAVDIRNELSTLYPEISEMNTYAIAMNQEYIDDEESIISGCEIALIPPVAGG